MKPNMSPFLTAALMLDSCSKALQAYNQYYKAFFTLFSLPVPMARFKPRILGLSADSSTTVLQLLANVLKYYLFITEKS